MSATEYVLLASVFYQRQADGRRVRYRTGDTVTGLSDARAARLEAVGAIKAKDGPVIAAAETAGVEPEDDAGGVEKPKQAAPKAAWVEYAANGAPEDERISEDEAEALSKAALIERFG